MKRSAIICLTLIFGAGLSAQVVHDTVFADNYFHSVFFTDHENGYIVGDFGAIQRTMDGGCSWTLTASGLSDARLLSVNFPSMGTGYVAGRDYTANSPVLLKTMDGGASWDALDVPSGGFEFFTSVFFLNDQVGYACGDHHTIMKTTDGGDSWEVQTLQSATYDPQYNDIFFLDTDTGHAVSGTGSAPSTLASTYDGGSTWSIDTITQAYSLSSVQFINESVGYCGGYDQGLVGILLRTSDGGSTWEQIGYGSNEWINDLHFTDELNGYISITNGLLKTSDGGLTWATIHEHQSANGGEVFITEDDHWHLAISALDFSELPPGSLGIAATSRPCSSMGLISSSALAGVELYPNPASDLLHLVLPPNAIPAHFHVYDASGRHVWSGTIKNENTEIGTSALSNGLYSISIVTQFGRITKRINVIN